ncbi:endonuclease/exonuclease/phosphatase family protein [Actinomadura syzygii]|uniref:Endonuclease/exonuclease/phosphatase family protein n=1 Tax=Actinomadura syzygii TaxID=1427538 RepID=A0A5D0ULX4_9ACTN|nr:endonuclease/exonuclease/phosphatase family protein [Actinomadura syzygii]TYC18907.1 endonuclease/exonuclease/phosphatase family protein [Actinomadura syzygii]
MRAPRALVPLLSVAAAAAVVAAAATGASIEGLPGGGGPAHADGAAPRPAAVTVNAMTWSVCGAARPGCPLGAAPDALGKQIVQRIQGTEVGGRKVRTDAVLLQDVCEGHVRAFKKSLPTWTWAFAASPGEASCATGQGRSGVAIGTAQRLDRPERTKLPAPAGRTRIALCADVPSWTARVCVTKLSAAEGAWRRKQATTLASLAGTGRVLLGGDLADTPESPALDPLYRRLAECDQSGPSRTGAATRQNWAGAAVQKTDYLFITKAAAVSCSVPASRIRASDHRPLSAVVRFP